MTTSLFLVSLTILLTFLVLSFVEKITTRRNKLKVDFDLEQVNVQPTVLTVSKQLD